MIVSEKSSHDNNKQANVSNSVEKENIIQASETFTQDSKETESKADESNYCQNPNLTTTQT